MCQVVNSNRQSEQHPCGYLLLLMVRPHFSYQLCLYKNAWQDGVKKATEYAILNANYMRARLEEHYDILY